MITLESKDLEITMILKKTNARFFKDLKVGDIIRVTMILRRVERNNKGNLHASHVQVLNLKTGDYFMDSITRTVSYLENFDWQEVETEKRISPSKVPFGISL